MATPILGHTRAVTQLWSAMANDSLHHAYLFEGPSGVGKHTVALRLAMAANCETRSGPDAPCGTCPTCKQIASGAHPDVITLAPDPASTTPIIKVDAVREVVRQTGYHRYGGRRRFILVDPAEAMQPAAANALLKTLEEPPDGTGFVLVCTNATALLPTIVSRCQRVRFGAVPHDDLAAWLVDRGVDKAEVCARLSHGCPGRALALAEGALETRLQLRDDFVGVLDRPLDEIYKFGERITKGRNRQQWSRQVRDLVEVAEDLLRDVVVTGSGSDLPPLNADIPKVVDRWTDRLWPTGVVVCTRALEEARANLDANVTGRTLVDALVIRFSEELRAA